MGMPWGGWPPPPPAPPSPVTSVFGRVGAIVALAGDYVASKITNDSSVVGATVKDALNTLAAAPGGVSSVFGRVGAVVALAGDYVASKITNDSGVPGATVKAALDNLLAAIPAVPVTSVFARTGAVVATLGDYAASKITNDSGVAGATVKAALDALLAAIPSVPVASVFARTGAVVAVAGDYTATLITNTSGVTGATVKDALDNLKPYFGVYGSRPAAGVAGRSAWLSDAPIGLWVDDGTKWRPLINGMLGIQPLAVAAMTAFNQGGATFTDNNGAISIVGVNDGASPGQQRGMVIANTAATAYGRASFQMITNGDVTAAHFAVFSCILRESGTGKIYALTIYIDSNGRSTLFSVDVWTSSTARASSTDKGWAVIDAQGPALALRVRRSGANVVAEISRDGLNWNQVDSRVATTVFTTAPDQVGWSCSGINQIPRATLVSFESGS